MHANHINKKTYLPVNPKKVQAKYHNLYINEGIQDTLGYLHSDERALKFKSFVFLTDVKELEDGPYCYVKGSHRRRRIWWRSALFNKKNQLVPFEFSKLKGAEAISLFAKAGEMVLSSQKGVHCGHTQHPEAKRTILVNIYQR